MGCIGGSNVIKDHLVVGTLNYCGIMNSPFQFYCKEYEGQLGKISRIFTSLIPQYVPSFEKQKDKFDWDMGKIDLKMRVGRYSPMFQLQVGIEDGKFVSKDRFFQLWQKTFSRQIEKIGISYKEEQKKITKIYDMVMYHTLLRYVYQVETVQQALQKDPQIYIKALRPFFNLTFLNEEKKLKKLRESFDELEADVFFFQEYSQGLLNLLKQTGKYHIAFDKSRDTLIIAKKDSFNEASPKDFQVAFERLSQQEKQNINWAERSAFLIIDKFVFICAHLSSKKEKNKPQIQQIKTGLAQLKKKYPQYEIIVGGDLNSYLPTFSKDFNIFPHAEELTTVKKRTMTQGQFHKGQKIIKQSKDKIISSLPFDTVNSKIQYITKQATNANSLVPSDAHPFDHFLLMVNIEINQIIPPMNP